MYPINSSHKYDSLRVNSLHRKQEQLLSESSHNNQRYPHHHYYSDAPSMPVYLEGRLPIDCTRHSSLDYGSPSASLISSGGGVDELEMIRREAARRGSFQEFMAPTGLEYHRRYPVQLHHHDSLHEIEHQHQHDDPRRERPNQSNISQNILNPGKDLKREFHNHVHDHDRIDPQAPKSETEELLPPSASGWKMHPKIALKNEHNSPAVSHNNNGSDDVTPRMSGESKRKDSNQQEKLKNANKALVNG